MLAAATVTFCDYGGCFHFTPLVFSIHIISFYIILHLLFYFIMDFSRFTHKRVRYKKG